MRAGGSGDCKISSSEITFGKVIGEGGKSTVHEGLLKRGADSIPVALKKYRVSRMSSRYRKQVETEAENFSKLQHPNVIKYYGTCLDQKTIVMEQMGLTLNNDIECKVNNVREYLDEMEIAGERTADAMRKHKKIPEVTMEEINNLVKERDASNACCFLALSTGLKTIEVMEAAEMKQNIHDILECLKSITEGAILNLPKEINGYRELDSHYSIMEAIDVMRKADILTCDINTFEMLPDNLSLKDYLQNAVLCLMESDKSEAAIYVCPPFAVTLIKLSKGSNQGYISLVDTHSIPQDLGGNGNGIVISTEYDGLTKNSKCPLVCDWLRKRTFLYGIPGETRQTLINIKENKEILTDLEWGDWNDRDMDESLLLSEEMLPSNNLTNRFHVAVRLIQ